MTHARACTAMCLTGLTEKASQAHSTKGIT